MQVVAAVAKTKPQRMYLMSDEPRVNKPGEKDVKFQVDSEIMV